MLFKVEFLKDVVSGEEGVTVEDKQFDESRWLNHFRLVFEHEGKLYATVYSRGKSESQDYSPYEDSDEDGEIECPEVKPVEKTIIEYVNA